MILVGAEQLRKIADDLDHLNKLSVSNDGTLTVWDEDAEIAGYLRWHPSWDSWVYTDDKDGAL